MLNYSQIKLYQIAYMWLLINLQVVQTEDFPQ